MALGDEHSEVSGNAEEVAAAYDDEGWPTLSELDLEVCVTDSAIPGVETQVEHPPEA